MSKAPVASPQPSAPAAVPIDNEKALFRSLAGLFGAPAANTVKTKRTHIEDFAVKDLTIDPRRNYRWQSEEGMKADLAAKDMELEDGTKASSYEVFKSSIGTLGVEEAIGVVKRGEKFLVIYGFTRAVAAKEVGLKVVPVYLYDSSLPEGEEKLLQLRENAPGLKRQVNWFVALKTWDELVTRMTKAGVDRDEASQAVCRVLGISPATMRNRQFILKKVDKRVQALAEEGLLAPAAAYEFYSCDAEVPFEPEFIGAVLDGLKVKGKFPERITGGKVREVMEKVRKQGVDEFGGGLRPSRTPNKKRQSPAILRDIAVRLAVRAILDAKVTVNSKPTELNAMERHFEWGHIAGVGLGAGEIPPPPVLEADDEEEWTESGIEKAQQQHENASERYVTGMFVHAFLRLAVKSKAKDFDAWQLGYVVVNGARRSARQVFSDAVSDFAGEIRLQGLAAKVTGAWKKLQPLLSTWVKSNPESEGKSSEAAKGTAKK